MHTIIMFYVKIVNVFSHFSHDLDCYMLVVFNAYLDSIQILIEAV